MVMSYGWLSTARYIPKPLDLLLFLYKHAEDVEEMWKTSTSLYAFG